MNQDGVGLSCEISGIGIDGRRDGDREMSEAIVNGIMEHGFLLPSVSRLEADQGWKKQEKGDVEK